MIISGGFDNNLSTTVKDTWAFNVPRREWTRLPDAPMELEGHRALVSGLDIFAFGGHSAPGAYPAKHVVVSALSLGASAAAPAETPRAQATADPELLSDAGTESSSSDGERFVELPGGQVLPLGIFMRLRERLRLLHRAE